MDNKPVVKITEFSGNGSKLLPQRILIETGDDWFYLRETSRSGIERFCMSLNVECSLKFIPEEGRKADCEKCRFNTGKKWPHFCIYLITPKDDIKGLDKLDKNSYQMQYNCPQFKRRRFFGRKG